MMMGIGTPKSQSRMARPITDSSLKLPPRNEQGRSKVPKRTHHNVERHWEG
jgi:hypothetical protein